jgi:tetratricopeptide (TPR) repeat protein
MVDKGMEATKKSLEINPAYVPAYENLAAGYIMKGSYDEAADICEKVLKIKPSSARAHRLLELLEPLR